MVLAALTRLGFDTKILLLILTSEDFEKMSIEDSFKKTKIKDLKVGFC